jgi:lipopolysaccharide transport system ATP-binding protein
MMNDVCVEVHNLGKKYEIGGPQKVYSRLTDQVLDMVTTPVRRVGRLITGRARSAADLNETIWALRDVSLEIQVGEVVGIIGRNGAGKSTLLKILSRITEPSTGRATLYGRVGSLLEVGTGFHPELTGRENIFLNGAILGMGKAEITRKFDEIVAFAEIDRFIDTPVKHYSSGMYVRLAFAVAAHLDPEILLVDEVLAVGDVAFQKKCLGKMDDVSKQGRTVLFVSHNMGVLQTLCQRGILLQDGSITADGPISEVVARYLHSLEAAEAEDLRTRTDRRGAGKVQVVDIAISDPKNPASPVLRTGDPARFVFELSGTMAGLSCTFTISDEIGQTITVLKSNLAAPQDSVDPSLNTKFVCEVDELLLTTGRYRLSVLIGGGGDYQDFVEAAAIFDVEGGQLRGRPLPPPGGRSRMSVCLPHRWITPVAN